jgi:hypothetical protein
MADGGTHDFLEARVTGPFKLAQDRWRNVSLVLDDHCFTRIVSGRSKVAQSIVAAHSWKTWAAILKFGSAAGSHLHETERTL